MEADVVAEAFSFISSAQIPHVLATDQDVQHHQQISVRDANARPIRASEPTCGG